MQSSGIAKRISREQREAMLQFMIENPDLAKNKLSGPQGGIMKSMKWEELAGILNSCPIGVCKTPDKWSRSWQDWRSDVKHKASRLRRHVAGTGGGPSKGTPLTALEERLLSFIGETAVSVVTGVIDPIEVRRSAVYFCRDKHGEDEYGARVLRTNERMADAMERIASAMEAITASTKKMNETLKAVLCANRDTMTLAVSVTEALVSE
ncbi:hypothetical protein J437_LFUL015034 [Ladona fulva]|uniref:Regulatory protein zeste n=1 Tax=Ladona fulva TaxID=123851 RepID=A0A8K0P5K5_LADFU|nr:hypothetical protein J437_LFUL015034 [Ladona fulva]